MHTLFENRKAIVGMIHVGALPGTPRSCEPVEAIIERACEEARVYTRGGVDGLMIENMHDVPYLAGSVGPEITAAMTAVGLAVRHECSRVREGSNASAAGATGGSSARAASEKSTGSKLPVAPSGIGARGDSRTSVGDEAGVREEIHAPASSELPLGVQILAAANREALAVAQAIGAAFVRVENFAYAHVADEGLMPTAEAGPLLRYRRQIGAEDIKIIADVKKKHSSHALTGDISLAEAARTTEFFGADAIVVTGSATGQPTSPDDVATVKEAVSVPVCIGSGLTPENLPALWPHGDVFIVGSYFKREGLWSNPVDEQRVADFMATVARLRKQA